MKRIISLALISILMLSLVACNEECPVIGTWQEKHISHDGNGHIESTLIIYENGFAEWRSWWFTALGQKIVNGRQDYDWEYSNGTLRLENKTFVQRLIYNANTGTLTEQGSDDNPSIYKRIN